MVRFDRPVLLITVEIVLLLPTVDTAEIEGGSTGSGRTEDQLSRHSRSNTKQP